MSPDLALCTAIACVLGVFCARAAERKNRNVAGWFVLGTLFYLPARIALATLPALPKLEWEP